MAYIPNPSRKIVGQDRPKTDVERQIEEIEKELKDLPHHKATDHHIGRLRAKLAHLKDRQIESGVKSKGGGGGGYAVKKQGDATVVLVGPPSAGKSTLINALTNAESKVAAYAFTTVSVIPGMLKYKEAYIQILDVPGLIEGAAKAGRGRGREVLSVARNSDLVIIMTDVDRLEDLERITNELTGAGIRLNMAPPDVLVEKRTEGGLAVKTNIAQDFDKDMVKEISSEFGIKNADITIREKLSLDRLIDSFSKSRVYVPSLLLINKADTPEIRDQIDAGDALFISADKGVGLEELKEKIWEKLRFVQVFLVNENEEPNFESPIIMKVSQTLSDLAEKIGSDFAGSKKFAKIWGTGARFPAQEVSLVTEVQNGMQIRFL